MWEENVQWQEDFIDTPHFSKQNGSKHIFTVINILYKYAWMVSLTGKQTSVVWSHPRLKQRIALVEYPNSCL